MPSERILERNADVCRMYNDAIPVYAIADKWDIAESTVYTIVYLERKRGVKVHRPYMLNNAQLSGVRYRRKRAKKIRSAIAANKAPVPKSGMVSVAIASKLVGCSLGTVYGAIYHGKLKASRPRGHWAVRMDDLLEWCES